MTTLHTKPSIEAPQLTLPLVHVANSRMLCTCTPPAPAFVVIFSFLLHGMPSFLPDSTLRTADSEETVPSWRRLCQASSDDSERLSRLCACKLQEEAEGSRSGG